MKNLINTIAIAALLLYFNIIAKSQTLKPFPDPYKKIGATVDTAKVPGIFCVSVESEKQKYFAWADSLFTGHDQYFLELENGQVFPFIPLDTEKQYQNICNFVERKLKESKNLNHILSQVNETYELISKLKEPWREWTEVLVSL